MKPKKIDNSGRLSGTTVELRTIHFYICVCVLEKNLQCTDSTLINYECSRTTKAILAMLF